MVNFSPLTKLLLCYIVLPVLKKLYDVLERKSSETNSDWDDLGVAVLGGIVAFLEILCYGEEK